MRNRLLVRPLGIAVLTLLCVVALTSTLHGQKGWKAPMQKPQDINAAGEYREEVAMHFESFSPVCLEPSTSATFRVRRLQNKDMMVFEDKRPGLTKNPNPPPFYTRAEGAISSLGWVDQRFENVRVTGEVNPSGGRGGKGANSRQGLMARWDQGNNFYWFHIDFTNGAYSIIRSRFFGVMEPLAGSEGTVPNFRNTNSYFLEFELRGDSVQGRISEIAKDGTRKQVATSGPVKDPEPHLSGMSGFLMELAMTRPFEPLEASLANLVSEPLP